MIGAAYAGLAATGVRRGDRLHLEAPPLSAAQWEWGIHSFSVVAGDEAEYRVDRYLVERAYPRRIQGDLLSFGYNARATDRAGNEIRWLALEPTGDGTSLLADRRFILVLWRGRRSAAPTEVYMPLHMAPDRLVVVSEDRVTVGFGAETGSSDSSHALLPDAPAAAAACWCGMIRPRARTMTRCTSRDGRRPAAAAPRPELGVAASRTGGLAAPSGAPDAEPPRLEPPGSEMNRCT